MTIAGDTSGTWVGATNGVGLKVWFGLGVGSTNSGTAGAWAATQYISATGAVSVVGTNGATFYITGVQLEKGSTATSFDYRPYGTELALCQRYLPAFSGSGLQVAGYAYGTNAGLSTFFFPVPTRVAPTGLTYSNLSHFSINNATNSSTSCTSISFDSAGTAGIDVLYGATTGLTAGTPCRIAFSNASTLLYFTGCEL